jgi:hypothetical protein
MLQPVTQQQSFYNVSDFIADLCAGQFARGSEDTLKLGTPVQIRRTGVIGVVSGHNVNDVNRIRVSWFDRTNWIVRHEYFDRGVIEVMESATAPR